MDLDTRPVSTAQSGLAPGESTFCFNYQFIVSAGYLADWADDTFVIENML